MEAYLALVVPASERRGPDQAGQPARSRGQKWLRRLHDADAGFFLHNTDSLRRAELETYIFRCFDRAYHAELTEFAPLLLELNCATGTSGVAGIRPAANTLLFLEHYLDQPVEQVASDLAGQPVGRHEIVELCNLGAMAPGACQLINIVLAATLHRAGFRYAGFAGTAQLERIVRRQDFVVTPVAVADPARLGVAAAQWGTYYDASPNVMLVDLEQTMRALIKQPLANAAFGLFATTIRNLGTALRAFSQPEAESRVPVSGVAA